jgi:hypothetical protein
MGAGGCTSFAGDHQPRRRFLGGWACLLLAAIAMSAALLALATPARAEDTTPPRVTAFSITPLVDTSAVAQTVTVTATLTDNFSGVQADPGPWVMLSAPGLPHQMAQMVGFPLSRISGDALDGVYSGSGIMPQYSQAGVWTAELSADDLVGNGGAYDAATIDAVCGAGSAEVTNTATVDDTTPPQVTAFAVAPSHVDTESAAQTVTATVAMSDELSGTSGPGLEMYTTGSARQFVSFATTRVSGDDQNGVYSCTATLPRGSAPGVWTIQLNARDAVSNQTCLVGRDLDTEFGAGSGEVTNDATSGDTTPPQVTALSVSPTVVNTEAGGQQVSVTAAVTDVWRGPGRGGILATHRHVDQRAHPAARLRRRHERHL